MSGGIHLGGRDSESFRFTRRRRWWEMFGGDTPVPPFDPTTVPDIGMWIRADAGVTASQGPFATASRTVIIAANVATFSGSMDGGLTPSVGDKITVAGTDYTIGARTSGTVWAAVGPAVGIATAFTITKAFPMVSTALDQSGVGADFAGTLTDAAVIQTCGLRSVDGHPAFDSTVTAFSPTNCLILGDADAVAFGNNKAGSTFAAIVTGQATLDSLSCIQFGQNASTLKRLCLALQIDGTARLATRRVGGTGATLTNITTLNTLARCLIVVTVNWVTGDTNVYKNGGAAVFNATNNWPNGGNWSATTLSSVRIGGPTAARVETVLAYNRVLTDLERAYISDGLMTLYGLVP